MKTSSPLFSALALASLFAGAAIGTACAGGPLPAKADTPTHATTVKCLEGKASMSLPDMMADEIALSVVPQGIVNGNTLTNLNGAIDIVDGEISVGCSSYWWANVTYVRFIQR